MVSAPSVRRARKAAQKAEGRRYGHARAPIMRIVGALAVLAVVVLAVLALRAWMTDPLARGRAALAEGNARAARIDLMNAASDKPDDPAIRLDLARAYNDLGRGEEAMRQLDRAADLGVRDAILATGRAQAALHMGDARRAVDYLQVPVAASEQVRALTILADAHYRMGNSGAAAQAYDRALRLSPADARLWTAFARYRLSEQDMAGADAAADRARQAAPQSGTALAVKAEVVRTRAGPVAALPWFAAAIARDPDNVPILLEQAASLGEAGRYRAMLVPLMRAAELEPRNPRVLLLEATVAARGGEPALARTLLSRIGGGSADLPAVLQLRSAVELSLNTPVAAANYAARLVELQPDNRTARRLLAMALAAQDNPRGAIAAIDTVTTAPDADSWSLLLLAQSFAAIDWQVDAAQPVDRATRLQRAGAALLRSEAAGADSLDPALAVPAIRARLAAGDIAAARALADALARANPGVAQAALLQGDAARAGGDLASAAVHYRRAGELRFDEPVALRLIAAELALGDRAGAGETLNQFMAHWRKMSRRCALPLRWRAKMPIGIVRNWRSRRRWRAAARRMHCCWHSWPDAIWSWARQGRRSIWRGVPMR